MNWDAVSAIAEVLGLAIVFASLVYLASQVKQANLQAQGAAHASWMTSWNEAIKGWISDRDTIQVLQKGFDDFNSLSNVDKAIFGQQLAAVINHWVLAVDLAERGLLSETVRHGATELVISICSTTGGSEFLESSANSFPRGQELLKMVRAKEGRLPPFNILSPWWALEKNGMGE